MQTYYYTDRDYRDQKARELRLLYAGHGPRVVCRSHRNVQLDPSRVYSAEVSDSDRNAFGGYSPRFFPLLYVIEVR